MSRRQELLASLSTKGTRAHPKRRTWRRWWIHIASTYILMAKISRRMGDRAEAFDCLRIAAARAWGQAMVDAGLMPAVALKAWAEGHERTGPGKPCTARVARSDGRTGPRHGPQGESASPVPCVASAGTGAVE